MTVDYKEQIKKLSPASNKKFSIMIDHIIEIIETSLSKERILFRPIYVAGFPVEQQKNMLLILEDWGVLSFEKPDDYLLKPIEERFIVVSLETLYQIRKLLSEMNIEYDPITKLSGSLDKKAQKKILNKAMATIKLGMKEKTFIKVLSDFKSHDTQSFKEAIGTRDYKKLKQRVQKKLRGTSFRINTIKGGTFKPSYYQLEYVPNSER